MEKGKNELRYGTDYPEQCPPLGAHIIDKSLELFRICECDELEKNGQLNGKNFIPVWEQKGRKFPPSGECNAKAISFNSSLEKCYELISNYPKMGNKVILVKLNSKCGLLLKTKSSTHYNLWDYADPNLSSAIGDAWEEAIKIDPKIKVQ